MRCKFSTVYVYVHAHIYVPYLTVLIPNFTPNFRYLLLNPALSRTPNLISVSPYRCHPAVLALFRTNKLQTKENTTNPGNPVCM